MITVLGSINMDLIATVERLPKPGETLAGRTFSTAAGGKGANQALAAARAGAATRMAGAVGTDAFGEAALVLLREAQVDLTGVETVPGPTGTASILVGGDGENVIVVVAGANGELGASDARRAVQSMQGRDTLLLQLEVPAETVAAALDAARAAGVTTILNTAPLTKEATSLAEKADIVIANESEFALLTGRDGEAVNDLDAALEARHALSRQTIVVTLGARGVVAADDGKLLRAKGLDITPVDTVGAGDTFCGYLAAGIEAGLAFEQALHRAAVAGSLACLKPGAQPAIPLAIEVDGAMAKPSL